MSGDDAVGTPLRVTAPGELDGAMVVRGISEDDVTGLIYQLRRVSTARGADARAVRFAQHWVAALTGAVWVMADATVPADAGAEE